MSETTEQEEEEKRKVTFKLDQLPETLQHAQKELCRLHIERQPHQEALRVINKEMDEYKAVMKAFCMEERERAERDGTIAQTTSFEDSDVVSNPVRVNCVAKVIQPVPSAEDIFSVTGQALHNFKKTLTETVCRKVTEQLLEYTKTVGVAYSSAYADAMKKILNNNLQVNTMELLSTIRKEAAQVAGGPKIQYSIGMSGGDSSSTSTSVKKRKGSH